MFPVPAPVFPHLEIFSNIYPVRWHEGFLHVFVWVVFQLNLGETKLNSAPKATHVQSPSRFKSKFLVNQTYSLVRGSVVRSIVRVRVIEGERYGVKDSNNIIVSYNELYLPIRGGWKWPDPLFLQNISGAWPSYQAQIRRRESQEPVHKLIPSLLTPRQLTRFS